MELKYYLAILWRRKWVIIFTVVVTTVVTIIGSYMMAPQYSATATLWIPTSEGNSPVGSGEILLADRLLNTYAQIVTSGPVLTQAEQRMGIPVKQMKNSIVSEFIAQTELLQITVTDSDPQLAASVATNLGDIVLRQIQKTGIGRERRSFLFGKAGVPKDPTWLGLLPTPLWRELNISLGFLASLLAGIALAFLFEYLDTTLYTTKEIEVLTAAITLGKIPKARKQQLTTTLNGNSLHGEAFRYLRTSILLDQNAFLQTLLITSAIPKEGKSTIVANLALAIAQSRRKVIVVDADLRMPTLHKIFHLSTEVGLTTLLRQEATLAEALQDSNIPGVQIITSGPLSSNPAELLDSPQMIELLEQLKQQSNLVLIDTPSLMAVTDAAVLAPLVDGVALVVGRAQVHQEAVQTACDQLAAVNANLVGIIVNRADQDIDYYNRYVVKDN